MKKQITFILIFVLVFASCKNDIKVDLIKSGEFEFIKDNIYDDYRYFQYLDCDTGQFIIALETNKNKLVCYSFADSTKCFSTKIPIINKPNAFYYHNKDSIFITKLYATNLYLLNIKGELRELTYWNNPFELFEFFERKHDKVILEFMNTIIDPLVYRYGKLYISNITNFTPLFDISDLNAMNKLKNKPIIKDTLVEDDFSHLKNQSPSLIININDTVLKVNNLVGRWPDSYCIDKTYLPNGMWKSMTINNKELLVYSFACDHNVFIYNEKQLIKKVNCQSRYIKEFKSEKYGKLKNGKIWDYRAVTEPYYAGIYYDKFNNIYYRVAVHRQPYKKNDGYKNNYFTNEFSIIIMDDKFKIYKEIKFSREKYIYATLFVTKQGILLLKQNSKQGYFNFDKYEISH